MQTSGAKDPATTRWRLCLPGETFELQGTKFVVNDLRHETPAGTTDVEAQKEGYPKMEFYKDLILRMHKGVEWDPSEKVWVHEFEIAEA